MLILTRKIDQGIIIAGNIEIRILGVQRDRVKIGISAPRDIPVLREELVDVKPSSDNGKTERETALAHARKEDAAKDD